MSTTEELVSIQKNEYKATIYGELTEPLLLRSVALSSWLFYELLKWIRSTVEEGSKVMRRYTQLMGKNKIYSKNI